MVSQFGPKRLHGGMGRQSRLVNAIRLKKLEDDYDDGPFIDYMLREVARRGMLTSEVAQAEFAKEWPTVEILRQECCCSCGLGEKFARYLAPCAGRIRGWMDGWVGGWMDGWMSDGWMDD